MALWSPLQVLEMLKNETYLLPIDQNESQEQHIFTKIENNIQELEQNNWNRVLMNPPFGVDKSGERLETKFINQALDRMQVQDQVAAIVPNGLLNRKGEDVRLRMRLIEEFDLQRIVKLPLSIFVGKAQVHTSILYFAKNKSKGFTEVYDLCDTTDVQKLAYIDRNSAPEYILDHSIVRLYDYSLNPSDYPDSFEVPSLSEDALLSRWNTLLAKVQQGPDTEDDAQLCLFEPVKSSTGTTKRIKLLRKLCLSGWDLLEERLRIFCTTNPCIEKLGEDLFRLCAGQKAYKLSNAPYRIYGSSGFQGFSSQRMRYNTLCGLVIGRVGSNCGNVYKPLTDGIVNHNAMQVILKNNDLSLEIMQLLLYAAHLNQYRRGTGQPYIIQETPMKMKFSFPVPLAQQEFLLQNDGVLRILQQSQREIEEMEVIRCQLISS